LIGSDSLNFKFDCEAKIMWCDLFSLSNINNSFYFQIFLQIGPFFLGCLLSANFLAN
jgi:hypothetical protein